MGHHAYPDFCQYIPEKNFKAFCSAAGYCWSADMYWFKDTYYGPWNVFLLTSLTDKQQFLVKAVLVLVDDSVSG